MILYIVFYGFFMFLIHIYECKKLIKLHYTNNDYNNHCPNEIQLLSVHRIESPDFMKSLRFIHQRHQIRFLKNCCLYVRQNLTQPLIMVDL